MDKTNYVTGQIPTPADMNDGHLLTEDALSKLIASITGGISTVLLSNRPPAVTLVGVNWQISSPEQYAAVNGRFFKSPAAVLTTPVADKKVAVYFILKQADVNQLRYRLRDTGSTIVRESFSTTVRKVETARVEITESGGPTITPPAPILAPDDVGYLLLATITFVGTGSTIAHNTSILWNFPGGGIALGAHGPTHLPTGGDPVPLAAVGGPLGSTAGLLPDGMLAVILAALQDISISGLSPYLQRVTSGDNSLANPKISQIRLKHHSSLEVKDVGGDKQLGVRFASGPYAGDSGIASQSNHKHSLDESPITAARLKVSITQLSQLGTLIEIPPISSVSEILSARVLWSPPGFSKPYPGVECGWMVDPQTGGFFGVRIHQISANEVRMEIGSMGLTRLQPALLDMIVNEYTSAVTWDSATGDGSAPRNGEIFVKIVGARA